MSYSIPVACSFRQFFSSFLLLLFGFSFSLHTGLASTSKSLDKAESLLCIKWKKTCIPVLYLYFLIIRFSVEYKPEKPLNLSVILAQPFTMDLYSEKSKRFGFRIVISLKKKTNPPPKKEKEITCFSLQFNRFHYQYPLPS